MTVIRNDKTQIPHIVWDELQLAVNNSQRVRGLTHEFYKYPARFSPVFAGKAIELLSNPQDIVLDPYVGGGTSIVEGWVRNRQMIGTDVNELAIFSAKAKTTILKADDLRVVNDWLENVVPKLKCNNSCRLELSTPGKYGMNLNLRNSRHTKPLVQQALGTIGHLSSERARCFLRMVVLKTTQLAWDGRKKTIDASSYRKLLRKNLLAMLDGMQEFDQAMKSVDKRKKPKLLHLNADSLSLRNVGNKKVDLVITSPPYPGVHVLYHRWQIDGRKESQAPYWISGCEDGHATDYYTFGGRQSKAGIDKYFDTAQRTHEAIRSVMNKNAYFIQLVGFNNKKQQLNRYLECMSNAGFDEATREGSQRQSRLWRKVPNRKWYTRFTDTSSSSKEVALIHVAR